VITYRSYAVANHLANVSFDPIVGLASTSTTALADYAELSTKIVGPTGSVQSVSPAPVLFAATVPQNAPNATLGEAFLHLLVSPEGGAELTAGGAFSPLVPAWTDAPTLVPPVLAPDVVPLPPWAAAALA